jgi:hypothetical protein
MCYEFVQTRTRGTYILILLRSGNLIRGALQRVAGCALPSRQPTTTRWMDQSSLFPLYERDNPPSKEPISTTCCEKRLPKMEEWRQLKEK